MSAICDHNKRSSIALKKMSKIEIGETKQKRNPLMTTKVLTIDGPRLITNDIQTVLGKIRVEDIAKSYEVPLRKTVEDDGYQRELSKKRVNELADAIAEARVDLPTAVLLSRRHLKIETMEADKNGLRMLPIDGEKDPFYVVDGQHRIAALEKLYEENPDQWKNYELPFVCMIGASDLQEMEEFHVVNSTAKSVSTDLAMDLMKKRYEEDSKYRDWVKKADREWQVNAQTIIEELRERPVWKGRIRYPNEAAGPNTTIKIGALVNSLGVPLREAGLRRYEMEARIEILNAYWEGIRRVYGVAFEDRAPPLFNVQKTIGAYVFHALLPDIMLLVGSVTDDMAYEHILRGPLNAISGETVGGDEAEGIDFWRSGSKGASGQYSSAAGRKNLIEKIRRELPQLSVRSI